MRGLDNMAGDGAAGHGIPRSGRDRLLLVLIIMAPFVMTCVAISNPYLFMDETWFIRSHSFVFDSLGRPLIGYAFQFTTLLWERFGLHVTTISRVIGAVLLSVSGILVYYWLRAFRFDWVVAAAFAIGLLSLPGFQILAVTVFQIQLGTVAALCAGLLLVPFLTKPEITATTLVCLALSVALGAIAICTYQLAINLIVVMLLVPVLVAEKPDHRLQVRIALTYLGFLAVVVGYYLVWKTIFVTSGDPGMDKAYGPGGPGLETILAQFQKFPTDRFPQIANLWYVEDFERSIFFYLSVATVCAGAALLVMRQGWFGALKVAILAGTIPLSDSFRLLSPKGPTYTSAHAADAAWWFICALSIIFLSGRYARWSLVPVVMLGVGWATWTTSELALRNGREFEAISSSLAEYPTSKHVHVIAMAGHYPGKYEFGWTSGQSVSFVRSAVHSIIMGGDYPIEQIGITDEIGSPVTSPNPCGRPDLVIRMPSLTHECRGLGCRVPDDEVARMEWPVCPAP